MLEAEELNKDFGCVEAWEFIGFYICRENDQKSFCHFLKGETQALARLGTFQIWAGKQDSRELLSFFALQQWAQRKGRNNRQPWIKRCLIPGQFLQMERFHGPVEKGYAFLQLFMTRSGSFLDEKRMQIFFGLLEALEKSWKKNSNKLGALICHPP